MVLLEGEKNNIQANCSAARRQVSAGWAEDEDVLARQAAVDTVELKSLGFQFEPSVGDAHLVLGPDGYGRIFLPIFQ
jgi:hypothetical protein